MEFLAALLSAFGLGTRHASKASDRRIFATELIADFETHVSRAESSIRWNKARILLELQQICSNAPSILEPNPDLLGDVEKSFADFEANLRVARNTIENHRRTVARGSSLATLKSWDSNIAIFQMQISAAAEIERNVNGMIARYDELLSNAWQAIEVGDLDC